MNIPKHKLPAGIYEVVIVFAQPKGMPSFEVKLLVVGSGITEDDRRQEARREAYKYAGPYACTVNEPTVFMEAA